MGTYVDHDDVRAFLQRSDAFSSTTTPSAATVEQIIEGVEDDIDDQTGHAWRPRRPPGREIHDVQIDYAWRIGWVVPYIQLDHWQIHPLDTDKGDILEVLEGATTYVDWLATGSGKTEGRAADYFLEERMGRIYLARSFPLFRSFSKSIRVMYRYGEHDVWGDVHRLAVWMAAIEILTLSHDEEIAGGGLQPPEGQPVSSAIDQLQAKIDKRLGSTHWLRNPRPRFRISGGPRRGFW